MTLLPMQFGVLSRRVTRRQRREHSREGAVIWTVRLLRDLHYWVRGGSPGLPWTFCA